MHLSQPYLSIYVTVITSFYKSFKISNLVDKLWYENQWLLVCETLHQVCQNIYFVSPQSSREVTEIPVNVLSKNSTITSTKTRLIVRIELKAMTNLFLSSLVELSSWRYRFSIFRVLVQVEGTFCSLVKQHVDVMSHQMTCWKQPSRHHVCVAKYTKPEAYKGWI